MNAEQLMDGIRRVAQIVELFPAPIAMVLGRGLELIAETIHQTQNTQDQHVAVAALLVALRDRLRSETTAELQRALDASK